MGNVHKAKAYTRVASSEDADTRLAAQAEACVAWAELNGYTIGTEDIFREIGSGIRLSRPSLDKLLSMAAEGEFNALFVYSTDRLSRDLVQLIWLLKEFTGHGVELHFVEGEISLKKGDLTC